MAKTNAPETNKASESKKDDAPESLAKKEEKSASDNSSSKPANKKPEPKPKIGIAGYCNLKGLRFTTKARIEHYVGINNLPGEQTVEEWDKIVKKL